MEENIKASNSGFLKGFFISLFCVALGAIGMYFIVQYLPGTTVINKSEKEVTVNENGIADAVDKVYDAVVVVQVYQNGKLYGYGSGFIFKRDGNKYYIMTNNHVVTGSTSVKVVLSDDASYDVKLLGSDKYLDIAIISFESDKDYTVAEIGSSADTRVGDTVFTVGAPIDSNIFSWTVTRGILSGKDRLVSVSTNNNSNIADYVRTALTTDAVINSGNSGGPLCNSNGQVIGITNMKLVSEGIEGMSFAIPMDDAIEYANKIINGEDVSRPSIGISTADVSNAAYLYYYYGISIPSNVTEGVVVTNVFDNTPAKKAGIQTGDVILEINGKKITSIAELKYELFKYSVGDTVTLKYNHNGTEKEAKITLEKSNQ